MFENKPTEGPWVVVPHPRGFHDATTIFCGFEDMEDFDRSKHAWIELRGANQEANAEFITKSRETKAQRDELLAASMAMDEARDEYDRAYHPENRMRALNKERDALAKLRTAIRRAQGGGDDD